MSSEYRDKLRSIGFDRKHLTKTIPVPDDRTGERCGVQTEHRDGRVDATVLAPTIAVKSQTTEER
jgi:hypothetical protein